MTFTDEIRILDSVDTPEGLIVEIVHDPAEFFGRRVTLNKSNTFWFGAAMRQGRRLQFVTTMPVQDYLNVVEVSQAKRGSTVETLEKASNRPKIPSQQAAIKTYLRETACIGEKFIFPNFMVNYGVGWEEQAPKGRLSLLVTDAETLAWPAIFEPPSGARMPSTDGAHRTGSLADLIRERPEGIEALLANGVGVTFVMESVDDDRHQDFADCGKAKAIAESVKATWDKRDVVVRTARELVLSNPFLSRYVDATSASVNLSTNSALIWSMSAIRGSLISAFVKRHEDFDKLSTSEKQEVLQKAPPRLSAYVDALVEHVPLLNQLSNGLPATPSLFRKQRGGCVLMRGAGFGILMRAFRYAVEESIKPTDLARRLGKVDWFVLKTDMPEAMPSVEQVVAFLTANAQPAWFRLIAVNPDGGWRIKSTNDNLDAAFIELTRSSFKAA